MAQRFPVGTVPTEPTSCVPAGSYRVSVPLMAEGTTKAGDKLKYDSSLGFQIIEGEHAGAAVRDTNAFIIGAIDANGELADPEDWKKLGGTRLNNLIHAAGGEEAEDVDAMLAGIEGHEVIVYVSVEKDVNGTYPDKNRIARFYPVPDAAPKIAPKPVPTAQPRPTLPASRPGQVSASPRGANGEVLPKRVVATKPEPPIAATSAVAYPCPECEPRNDVPRRKYGQHLALHESFNSWPEDKRPRFIPADANEEWTPA